MLFASQLIINVEGCIFYLSFSFYLSLHTLSHHVLSFPGFTVVRSAWLYDCLPRRSFAIRSGFRSAASGAFGKKRYFLRLHLGESGIQLFLCLVQGFLRFLNSLSIGAQNPVSCLHRLIHLHPTLSSCCRSFWIP